MVIWKCGVNIWKVWVLEGKEVIIWDESGRSWWSNLGWMGCVSRFASWVNACTFCQGESVLAASCGLAETLWMTVKISSPSFEPTISMTMGKLFIISAPLLPYWSNEKTSDLSPELLNILWMSLSGNGNFIKDSIAKAFFGIPWTVKETYSVMLFLWTILHLKGEPEDLGS